jgi:NADH:ubiquinone oxidoreductase subunit B-like Fe-S oxidoreductase
MSTLGLPCCAVEMVMHAGASRYQSGSVWHHVFMRRQSDVMINCRLRCAAKWPCFAKSFYDQMAEPR